VEVLAPWLTLRSKPRPKEIDSELFGVHGRQPASRVCEIQDVARRIEARLDRGEQALRLVGVAKAALDQGQVEPGAGVARLLLDQAAQGARGIGAAALRQRQQGFLVQGLLRGFQHGRPGRVRAGRRTRREKGQQRQNGRRQAAAHRMDSRSMVLPSCFMLDSRV
jgi:hypothetical protein